jgi:hypothetical protein
MIRLIHLHLSLMFADNFMMNAFAPVSELMYLHFVSFSLSAAAAAAKAAASAVM